MDNFTDLPPPTAPAASNSRLPLFRKPFYKDWTVILGLLTVASGAASNVGTSGDVLRFKLYDWIAFVINLAFITGVQGTVFGVIPALIRRRLKRRRMTTENEYEVFPKRFFWGMAFIIAFTSAFLVSLAQRNDDSSFIGLSDRTCEQEIEGTKCVRFTYLGNEELSIQINWKYLEMREFSGEFISEVTYTYRILCKEKTGYVSDLNAFSSPGQAIVINEAERSQVTMGIQNEVNQVVNRLC